MGTCFFDLVVFSIFVRNFFFAKLSNDHSKQSNSTVSTEMTTRSYLKMAMPHEVTRTEEFAEVLPMS